MFFVILIKKKYRRLLAYLEEADKYKLHVVYRNSQPTNAIYEIYPQIHEGFVHLSALQTYLNTADKFQF